MSGPTGLCYEAIYPLIDRITDDPVEWDDLLDDIGAMERSALAVIRED